MRGLAGGRGGRRRCGVGDRPATSACSRSSSRARTTSTRSSGGPTAATTTGRRTASSTGWGGGNRWSSPSPPVRRTPRHRVRSASRWAAISTTSRPTRSIVRAVLGSRRDRCRCAARAARPPASTTRRVRSRRISSPRPPTGRAAASIWRVHAGSRACAAPTARRARRDGGTPRRTGAAARLVRSSSPAPSCANRSSCARIAAHTSPARRSRADRSRMRGPRQAASAAPRSVAGSPPAMYSSSIARNGPLTSSLPRIALMPHGAIEDHERRRRLSASITRWCRPWTSNIFPIVSLIHWRRRELVAQVRLVRTAHVVVHELGVDVPRPQEAARLHRRHQCPGRARRRLRRASAQDLPLAWRPASRARSRGT